MQAYCIGNLSIHFEQVDSIIRIIRCMIVGICLIKYLMYCVNQRQMYANMHKKSLKLTNHY